VDMNKAHLAPVYDVASHLVYAANGKDVSTTIVDGKVLMEDGKVLSMDEQEVIDTAIKASKDLLERIGN
ncbi:MAG: 5-methylthioadenosine/S-adenosylhomocysteine deaminase, partial [Methanolobus sp.]|nr:5-methylthioadenosine/S-adenosylhomocysteine deaminase [Methanolobus sp.]